MVLQIPFFQMGLKIKSFYDLFKMMREKRPDRPEKIEVEEISSSEIEDLIKKGENFYLWVGTFNSFSTHKW